jgi:hypothetical protein
MERSHAAWSNDILMQVTRHSTLLELRVVSHVAKPWLDAARTAALEALLDHQFNSKALLRLVGFSPPRQRVNRIMSATAFPAIQRIDPASCRAVIEIQLALNVVRMRTPSPHRVSLGHVVDLLVGTAGLGLSTRHRLVQHALESIHINRELLDLNVANEIPYILQAWRQELVDWVCIRNVLIILLNWVYIPRDLLRVLSGATA